MPDAYGVTSPYAWYKADAFTGYVNNDPVDVGVDSSGNGRDLGQPSPSLRPVYKTNVVNSLPAVRFASGSGQHLLASGVSTAQKPTTLVAVVAPTITGVCTIQGSVGGAGLQWRLNDGKSEFVHQATAAIGTAVAAVPATPPSVIMATYSGTGVWTHYTNDTVNGTGTTDVTLAASSLIFGANGGLSEYFDGDIFEFLVFARVLDSAERASMKDGLRSKYGLNGGTTHTRTITRLISTHTG